MRVAVIICIGIICQCSSLNTEQNLDRLIVSAEKNIPAHLDSANYYIAQAETVLAHWEKPNVNIYELPIAHKIFDLASSINIFQDTIRKMNYIEDVLGQLSNNEYDSLLSNSLHKHFNNNPYFDDFIRKSLFSIKYNYVKAKNNVETTDLINNLINSKQYNAAKLQLIKRKNMLSNTDYNYLMETILVGINKPIILDIDDILLNCEKYLNKRVEFNFECDAICCHLVDNYVVYSPIGHCQTFNILAPRYYYKFRNEFERKNT